MSSENTPTDYKCRYHVRFGSVFVAVETGGSACANIFFFFCSDVNALLGTKRQYSAPARMACGPGRTLLVGSGRVGRCGFASAFVAYIASLRKRVVVLAQTLFFFFLFRRRRVVREKRQYSATAGMVCGSERDGRCWSGRDVCCGVGWGVAGRDGAD